MRRTPYHPERSVQIQVQQLFRSVGGTVYTFGTVRRKGSSCPKCGTFVPEWLGTRQSPGIAGLQVFLPPPPGGLHDVLLVMKVKAPGGRLSEGQRDLRTHCDRANIPHLVGGLTEAMHWLLKAGYLRPDQVAHYRLPADVPD